MQSISQPDEPLLPDDLTWRDLFNLRNYYAMTYAKRWQGIPMEEFQSAGNAALADVLTDPDVPHDRGTFLSWIRHRMNHLMWQVPAQEYGRDWRTGKPRTPVPTMPLDPERITASRPAPQEAAVYLREVCAFLAAYPYPERLATFWQGVAGESPSEIAHTRQLSAKAVKQRSLKLRRDLWTWTGETTVRAQRSPAKLTPTQQAKVYALREQGLSTRQIAAAIGRGQTTVRAVLHGTKAYAGAVSSAAAD